MKRLTRKEAQEQLELLLALQKLDRIVNQPRAIRRAKRAQKKAAAAA